MKACLLTVLAGLFISTAIGQVSFSPVDSKLKTVESNNLSELICSSPAMSVKFQLNRKIKVLPQDNFCMIDSQAIQVTPLSFSGYRKDSARLSIDSEKQLLGAYSKYELEYFKNDLGVEVINPNNQWVVTKGKGWFIWYFKVGNAPVQVDKKTFIQLFASTVIGDMVLTINAPILSGGDFAKAGIIVNEMMETLTIAKP